MSFEPLVLMPDPASLSTPHVYRAHSYAGAATGGLFHTNVSARNSEGCASTVSVGAFVLSAVHTQCLKPARLLGVQAFVENNPTFLNWQVGMAVSQYSAEMTELLPAFTSRERFYPAEPPRPEVTVAAAEATSLIGGATASQGSYPLIAKVLTEQTPARGVQPDRYYCHTVVTVNPHATPCVAKLVLASLLAGSGLPAAFPAGQLPVQRMFNGQYRINLTALANGSVMLTDFIDARTANVYRIGCDTAAAASYDRAANLIADGDFERLADPGAPGHLLAVESDGRGRPTASAYSATMSAGGPGGGNRSDDRTRITTSLADPFDGRYAAKVNLGVRAAH